MASYERVVQFKIKLETQKIWRILQILYEIYSLFLSGVLMTCIELRSKNDLYKQIT